MFNDFTLEHIHPFRVGKKSHPKNGLIIDLRRLFDTTRHDTVVVQNGDGSHGIPSRKTIHQAHQQNHPKNPPTPPDRS